MPGNVTGLSDAVATYDLSGRWSRTSLGGTTLTASYNALGQRVRKFSSTGAASTTLFVYDQDGQLLGEYDNTGAAIREYVWLGSTLIAMFTPDPASQSNPPLTYFIHTDHIATQPAGGAKTESRRGNRIAAANNGKIDHE